MFKLKLQPVATHFQESSFDLYILQRPWMGHKVEHRTFPPCPTPLFYLIYSIPQISNHEATEVSLQWPELSLHSNQGHLLWIKSTPILGDHRRAGTWILQNTVWSKFHLQLSFCICVCFCKYFIYTNIYIHMFMCIYIYSVYTHISERYTLKC